MVFPNDELPVDPLGRRVKVAVRGYSEVAKIYENNQNFAFGPGEAEPSEGAGQQGGFTWISPKTKGRAGKRVGQGGRIEGEDPNWPSISSQFDKSDIQGKGSFAKNDLEENETIGLLHTINKPGVSYDFTELGKMHNHSDDPNCHNVLKDKQRFLVASRPIKKGEELTTNYRLQPDLEQPEHFGLLESDDDKEMLPHIDGYRSYSPFQDLVKTKDLIDIYLREQEHFYLDITK